MQRPAETRAAETERSVPAAPDHRQLMKMQPVRKSNTQDHKLSECRWRLIIRPPEGEPTRTCRPNIGRRKLRTAYAPTARGRTVRVAAQETQKEARRITRMHADVGRSEPRRDAIRRAASPFAARTG